MGKLNLIRCLPLAKAPFRFRTSRLNGVIGPPYPDLTNPSVRVSGSYDVLSETLRYSLPEWRVKRSNDGFGFDLLHPTWGGLYDVNPVKLLSGRMQLPERVPKAVSGALEHIWNRMVMEFQSAVEAGHCEIWARVKDDTAEHQKIPASAWAGVKIRDWSLGKAETEAGVLLYDIHVCPARNKARVQSASGRAKRRGGRPPAVDWSTVESKLFRLMDEHGEFSPDDPEWNAQARLEEMLLEFCSRKFGKETSQSTLRGKLPDMLQRWRNKRSIT